MSTFTDLSGKTSSYTDLAGNSSSFTDGIFQPEGETTQFWDSANFWDGAYFWDGNSTGQFNTNFTDLTGV